MISGIVFADKPAGMSSPRLVSILKKRLGGVKTGHTGTLDRFASGFMLLTAGHATSFSDYFLHMDKTYRAVISFGKFTDTHDPTGQILQEKSEAETYEFLRQIETKLAGIVSEFEKISFQTPPLYSALKKDGIRFSDRARKGEIMLPVEREVRIFSSKLMNLDIEKKSCVCEFHVSSGTYIRSIVRDLAVRLGFPAHLSELIRAGVGSYALDDERIWRDFDSDPRVIPVMEILNWPRVTVDDDRKMQINNGQKISLAEVPDGNFFLVTAEQEPLAWLEGRQGDYIFRRVFKA